ncbi:MAG TPA: hypothetical protein VF467_07685 [Afipia sp.]
MSSSPFEKLFHPLHSSGVVAMLGLVVAVPALLMLDRLGHGLVMPALSVVLFCAAAIAALLARSINVDRNSDHVNLWDVAGGFAMTGCATSILGEPEQVVHLFEYLFERHPTAG